MGIAESSAKDWYNKKRRPCPKCGSKDTMTFRFSNFIRAKCLTCGNSWEIEYK